MGKQFSQEELEEMKQKRKAQEMEMTEAHIKQIEAQTREIELHSKCFEEEHNQKIRHNEERHSQSMSA